MGGSTTVGSSPRSHIHLTAKPFDSPCPGGPGPPVCTGKGPGSMAPGPPGSSRPEASQLSLKILPRASEKGPTPYLPTSRLAPGDRAAGTKVLVTKALSLVLSDRQVPQPRVVSQAPLGPPCRVLGQDAALPLPPHHLSPQSLPRVGPGFRTGPRQFQRSEGERGPGSEGQWGACSVLRAEDQAAAPRALHRRFRVWPSWTSPPPRVSDRVCGGRARE